VSSEISHSGVIEHIEEGCVKVLIQQPSACASCQIAGHCGASDGSDKTVDVHVGDMAGRWSVGQRVKVVASNSVARLALLLGFVLPLFVVLAVLLTVLWLTNSEGTAALVAVLVLVPYYLGLWLQRDRISRRVVFRIEQYRE
jgi:sigma-E factor negative regulatory protein RseC